MMAEEIKKFKNFILKDFGRINDQCMSIQENINTSNAKMKNINSTFDKMDKSIVDSQYKIKKLEEELSNIEMRMAQEKKQKTDTQLIEELKDEFTKLKAYTTFSMEDSKSRVTSLQEYLTHYIPIQTHLQVCEAFDFLNCLSSAHKLILFKMHKSRMLKINQSKKTSEYYFYNNKNQLEETLDAIIKNADKEIIDPKLRERVANADTEQATQTDYMRQEFHGKTDFREVWLVRSAKSGHRYTQHWNRYLKAKQIRDLKRELALQKSPESSEFEAEGEEGEESESERLNKHTSKDEFSHEESLEIEDKMTPLPQEEEQKSEGISEIPEITNIRIKSESLGLKSSVKMKDPGRRASSKHSSKLNYVSNINNLKEGYFETSIKDSKTNQEEKEVNSEVSSELSEPQIGVTKTSKAETESYKKVNSSLAKRTLQRSALNPDPSDDMPKTAIVLKKTEQLRSEKSQSKGSRSSKKIGKL